SWGCRRPTCARRSPTPSRGSLATAMPSADRPRTEGSMRRRGMLTVLALMAVVSLSAGVPSAVAQPTVSQLLAEMGLSDGDKQKVLNGDFVTLDVTTLSARDLAVNIVFLVKMGPEVLGKELMGGDSLGADSQV